jgi:hypothetical protein
MRNQLFTLALAAFSGFLSAQSAYHPMLAPDRTWDIFNTTIGPEPCPYISAYHAFIGGDSVINGLTYKKIVHNPILSGIAFPWCGSFYVGDTVYQSNPFLLREDSAARKVYHYTHDDQAEYVLFDFNLQTGDTLKTNWGDGNWIIDTVFDYTLANGETRKRFQGAGFPDNAYVEGLGYLFGAFTVPYYPLEGWAITTCVRDGEKILYNNVEDCVNPKYEIEFAPIGATWHYTQAILGIPVQSSFVDLTITGDTIFYGETWRILANITNTAECALSKGFLRQINDQVYFRRDANATPFLLYDFGLQKGESYSTVVLSGIPMNVKIDSIGTTNINGESLKTWFISCEPPFWGTKIIEKVGNLDYLIPFYGGCDPIPGPIRCYTDNDDFFKWVTYPCDSTFTLSASDIFENQDFKISPNPFGSQLRLEITDGGARQSFLFELLDPMGRNILQQEIPEGTAVFNMDLPQLPSGIYFWSVGGRFGGRLVKE